MANTSTKLTSGVPLDYLAATDEAGSAPDESTATIRTGKFSRVRTLLTYADQVDSCNVRLWIKADGAWFRGGSTDDFDPLAPGGASAVNESRDWLVGKDVEIAFTFEDVSGGGTIALAVQGVGE